MSIPRSVQLQFRTIDGALLAQAVDRKGNVVMVEALPQMRSYLDALGFKWVTGSQGVWTRDGSPKYENVSCSQCGRGFGPGDHGFSHCDSHQALDKVKAD